MRASAPLLLTLLLFIALFLLHIFSQPNRAELESSSFTLETMKSSDEKEDNEALELELEKDHAEYEDNNNGVAEASGRGNQTIVMSEETSLDSFLKICHASSRRGERPGLFPDGPHVQYVHIPKAGGSSIQKAIMHWMTLAPNLKMYRYDGPSYRGTSDKCPAHALKAGILIGHRGFGFCSTLVERENSANKPFYFTAAREPISRMISLYDYDKRQRQTEKTIHAFGRHVSLNDLVIRYNKTVEKEYGERLLRYSGSQQARFMCGFECMGPLASGSKGPSMETILAKAKTNLLRTDAVGVLERLDDLFYQLHFHLSWVPRGTQKWPSSNKSHVSKSKIGKEAEAILYEWSYVDREFYKLAERIEKEKTEIAKDCWTKAKEKFREKK